MTLQRIRYGTLVKARGRVGIVNGIALIADMIRLRLPDSSEVEGILPGECEVLQDDVYGATWSRKDSLPRVLDDAAADGFTVRREGNCITVYKEVMINQYRTRRKGICVYSDGKAVILGLDLDACKSMGVAEMRKALGLKEAKLEPDC